MGRQRLGPPANKRHVSAAGAWGSVAMVTSWTFSPRAFNYARRFCRNPHDHASSKRLPTMSPAPCFHRSKEVIKRL